MSQNQFFPAPVYTMQTVLTIYSFVNKISPPPSGIINTQQWGGPEQLKPPGTPVLITQASTSLHGELNSVTSDRERESERERDE